MGQWQIYKFRMGGSATGAWSAPEKFGVATSPSGHMNASWWELLRDIQFGLSPSWILVRTEYFEATLALVKHPEIYKELCNYAWLLLLHATLHNHLMELCSYVRKNTLLGAKG